MLILVREDWGADPAFRHRSRVGIEGQVQFVQAVHRHRVAHGRAHPREPDAPAQAVGDGLTYLERFPSSLRGALQHTHMDCWPSARDLLPLAEARFAAGETEEAAAVVPVYVRDEVSWKKLSEQGKSA